MNIYTIYKITNQINDKCYIGFTSNNPNDRLRQHVASAKNGSDYKIHQAIRKYTVQNFIFETLYQSKDRHHTHRSMEKYFIKEFNSHYKDGYGYNMSYGGEGCFGYKHSEETKKKMSETRMGKNNPFYGKTHSNQHKELVSLKVSRSKCKYIYTVYFDNDALMETDNLNKFAKEYNYSFGSLYSLANKNRNKYKNIKKIDKFAK